MLPNAALDEAGGDAAGVADELHRQLGNAAASTPSSPAVSSARESTDLGGGKAGKLATQAFDAHHDDGHRARR